MTTDLLAEMNNGHIINNALHNVWTPRKC